MRIIIKQKNMSVSFNYNDIILIATKNTLTFYTNGFKLIKSIFYKNADKFILNVPATNDDIIINEDEEEKNED